MPRGGQAARYQSHSSNYTGSTAYTFAGCGPLYAAVSAIIVSLIGLYVHFAATSPSIFISSSPSVTSGEVIMDNVKVFQSKADIGDAVADMLASSRQKLLQPEANLQWRFQVDPSPKSSPRVCRITRLISIGPGYVFFADERYVPLTHDDSNFKSCQEVLFSKLSIPKGQIYPLDTSLALEDAAAAYASTLVSTAGKDVSNGIPRLDAILLGMGPDGHTCSLFPDHALLSSTSLVASLDDSPKLPPSRVTLTLPVVNSARTVAFVTAGASKAEVLSEVLGGASTLPAARVKPDDGSVVWYIDADAASKL